MNWQGSQKCISGVVWQHSDMYPGNCVTTFLYMILCHSKMTFRYSRWW